MNLEVECQDDVPKQDRPMAYVSRCLRGTEIENTVTENVCLAVLYCVSNI